jgi:hypothetical protein
MNDEQNIIVNGITFYSTTNKGVYFTKNRFTLKNWKLLTNTSNINYTWSIEPTCSPYSIFHTYGETPEKALDNLLKEMKEFNLELNRDIKYIEDCQKEGEKMKLLTVNDVIETLQKIDEKDRNKICEFIGTEGISDYVQNIYASEYVLNKDGYLTRKNNES